MSGHDVDFRFRRVQVRECFQLTEHLRAVFLQEKHRHETGAFTQRFDVAKMPGHVAKQQQFRAVCLLHIDHLAAGRVAG